MRESVRLASLSKNYVYRMFKLDQSIIETIFDFLVNEEAIIEEEVDQ